MTVPKTPGVGDVLIASTFVVSPTDVAEHREHCLMSGAPFEPGEAFRGMRLAAQFGAAGRACPVQLLVRRAVESVIAAMPHDEHTRIIVRDVSRTQAFATPVVGEGVTPVVTIRYRSPMGPETVHVTLDVALRRRSGRVLARCRVGLEVTSAPRVRPEAALVLDLDAA